MKSDFFSRVLRAPDSEPQLHAVFGTPLRGPFAPQTRTAYFALGCFWGAERIFWRTPGVVSTAVGYAGGSTPDPTYWQVCSGATGHTETVQVVYDPARVSYAQLLQRFWQEHDPTQGNRQGNDVGSEYRSAIFWTSREQRQQAEVSRDAYERQLFAAGYGPITTQIAAAGTFFFAEPRHQQYLHRFPRGYCGIRGTGVACAVPEPDPDPDP